MPGSLRKAVPLYLHAVREECADAAPATLSSDELTVALPRAKSARVEARPATATRARPGKPSAVRRASISALYRAWQQQGDAVLWALASHVLKDKFNRG